MKRSSLLFPLAALCGFAAFASGATAKPSHAKVARPNCQTLRPIGKIEEVMGGAATLEHFGKSDFVQADIFYLYVFTPLHNMFSRMK